MACGGCRYCDRIGAGEALSTEAAPRGPGPAPHTVPVGWPNRPLYDGGGTGRRGGWGEYWLLAAAWFTAGCGSTLVAVAFCR